METQQLARLFRIPDLPDRLAAVDRKIVDTLGRDGELLAPAALRVATSGGKRLRPLLAVVSAAVGDVFDDRVATAAAAVELVQVGSLVHDDILDRATTRRGQPTINAVEGIDHAVLAGDYILARAAGLAVSVSREAAALVADTLGALCEGQALEARDAFDLGRSTEAHLRSIHGKTAALFACACRLGALTAGVRDRDVEALTRYGAAFGMGFQLLDDVLDLVGDSERLGKPTGLDIASGVYTLPVLTALDGPLGAEVRRHLPRPERGPEPVPEPVPGTDAGVGAGTGVATTGAPEAEVGAAATAGADAVGADVTGEGVDGLAAAVELVRSSGGVSVALQEMDRYVDDARRAVAHLDQTAVGEGLTSFPHAYTRWALEAFMDPGALAGEPDPAAASGAAAASAPAVPPVTARG